MSTNRRTDRLEDNSSRNEITDNRHNEQYRIPDFAVELVLFNQRYAGQSNNRTKRECAKRETLER